jgi:multiple sugar transport system permease protein
MKPSKHLGRIIVKFTFCVILTLIIIIPLYWMVVTSLKEEGDVITRPLQYVPKNPTTENYEYAFTQTKLPSYFFNSLIYVTGTVLISVFVGSLAAYSVSRYKHRGKMSFMFVVLFTQYMPLTMLLVPLYIVFSGMGLLNNRMAIILLYCAIQVPIGIWLLLGYFLSIPRTLDEAAAIDGCTTFQTFYRIVLPLARPGLIAIATSVAISVWQELILATTFTTSDALRPVMVGISQTIGKSGVKWGQLAATGVAACVPMLVIYGVFQKFLVRGLTEGAVKG